MTGTQRGTGSINPSSTTRRPCNSRTLRMSRLVMKLRGESGALREIRLPRRSSGAHKGFVVTMISNVRSVRAGLNASRKSHTS